MSYDNRKNLAHPNDFETSDQISISWICNKLKEISEHCCADVIAIYGPIFLPVDETFKLAIERTKTDRDSLLVIVDTPGGYAEVTERIVETMRHYYGEVKFLVADKAMSAGTILVMSGDAIIMDHFARLGPVDPQVSQEGKTTPVSALSYLEPYQELLQRSEERELTTAELVLLQQFDLADLRQYELAVELSVTLIQEWLQKYKFKDWLKHSSTGILVTPEDKKKRAKKIATALSKQTTWRTHHRMISRDTLEDLGLIIDKLEDDCDLATLINDFYWFFRDFVTKRNLTSLIVSPTFF